MSNNSPKNSLFRGRKHIQSGRLRLLKSISAGEVEGMNNIFSTNTRRKINVILIAEFHKCLKVLTLRLRSLSLKSAIVMKYGRALAIYMVIHTGCQMLSQFVCFSCFPQSLPPRFTYYTSIDNPYLSSHHHL